MKMENKNAFTILKEFSEKVKLNLIVSFKTISEEKAPISYVFNRKSFITIESFSFASILTIERKEYIGIGENYEDFILILLGKPSKQEAKMESSKIAIMELLKNESFALNFFINYLDKG